MCAMPHVLLALYYELTKGNNQLLIFLSSSWPPLPEIFHIQNPKQMFMIMILCQTLEVKAL